MSRQQVGGLTIAEPQHDRACLDESAKANWMTTVFDHLIDHDYCRGAIL